MLIDESSKDIVDLINNLRNQIIATVGEDAKIIFPDTNIKVNNYSVDKIKEQYNELIENDTDIILALGALSSQTVSKYKEHRKPTILLGAINKDMNIIDFKKKKSGIKNLTYLLEPDSYKQDLETLKSLTEFRKVGILIEKKFTDILPVKKTLDLVANQLNIGYKLIPFDNVSVIDSELDEVDAVYIAGGFFLSEKEVVALSDLLKNKKLPSFTINPINHVQLGIMGSRSPSNYYEKITRRLALTIESYISGNLLSEMNVLIYSKPTLTINYSTANAVGLPLKYSLAYEAAFIGDLNTANPAEVYSLKNAIDKAIGKNLHLQETKKRVELSIQKVKRANNNYLPTVVASAVAAYIDPDWAALGFGLSPEFQVSSSLNLQQTLFSESLNANKTIQKELKEAEQERYNGEELNTILDVTNTYFSILIIKSNAQILRSNLQTSRKNLSIAEQNYEAGLRGKSDVLRFQSEIAQNTQLLIEIINRLEQEYVRFNQLLNNPLNTKIDIEEVSLASSELKMARYDEFNNLLDNARTRDIFIQFLVEQAKINSPELKYLSHSKKALERNVRLNSGGRFVPTVGLQAQYNTIYSRNGAGANAVQGLRLPDNNYNIGVSVSIPIFNKNQTNTSRQTAIIEKAQLSIQQKESEQNIGSNVHNGVLRVINQITNMSLSKKAEEAAKQALKLTQASYANGAVNIAQLIDAQNNFLNAQLNSTTAVYNYLLSISQVERYVGHFFLMNSKSKNANFLSKFFEYNKLKK